MSTRRITAKSPNGRTEEGAIGSMPTNDHYGHDLEGQGYLVMSEWSHCDGLFYLSLHFHGRMLARLGAPTIVAARRKMANFLRTSKPEPTVTKGSE